ncbi:hypothetical protein L581_4035 [Serratia fonticola AU-AP2C]|nr:hypothetical protein L581_4035 [Serratia fonticola AU-AP2C]
MSFPVPLAIFADVFGGRIACFIGKMRFNSILSLFYVRYCQSRAHQR